MLHLLDQLIPATYRGYRSSINADVARDAGLTGVWEGYTSLSLNKSAFKGLNKPQGGLLVTWFNFIYSMDK